MFQGHATRAHGGAIAELARHRPEYLVSGNDTVELHADVAPLRLHISRRYGFPFQRAARTLDGRLRDGRSPGLRLERPFRPSRHFECEAPVAYPEATCRLQLRAQPRLRQKGLTAFPICTSEDVQTDRHTPFALMTTTSVNGEIVCHPRAVGAPRTQHINRAKPLPAAANSETLPRRGRTGQSEAQPFRGVGEAPHVDAVAPPSASAISPARAMRDKPEQLGAAYQRRTVAARSASSRRHLASSRARVSASHCSSGALRADTSAGPDTAHGPSSRRKRFASLHAPPQSPSARRPNRRLCRTSAARP